MQAVKSVSALDAKHAVAQARVASDTVEKQLFTRNTFKCTTCMRVHRPDGSPLVLCDFCHRSFHQLCLPESEGGLPQWEWACPYCLKRHEQNKARLQDLQQRKTQALRRVAEVRSTLSAG